jgi:hypothetical protein
MLDQYLTNMYITKDATIVPDCSYCNERKKRIYQNLSRTFARHYLIRPGSLHVDHLDETTPASLRTGCSPLRIDISTSTRVCLPLY